MSPTPFPHSRITDRNPSHSITLALISILSFLGSHASLAVPANPAPLWLQQPDGQRFIAQRWGDEREHGYETYTGFTIVLDAATQTWFYAVQRCDGRLIPSVLPVRTPNENADIEKGLQKHLRPLQIQAAPCLDQAPNQHPRSLKEQP